MNFKIMKDELLHFFIRILFFLFFKMKLLDLRNLVFFHLGNDKVSEI